jgi:hypothetical protein
MGARTYYWHFILMISGAVTSLIIFLLKWGNLLTFRNRKEITISPIDFKLVWNRINRLIKNINKIGIALINLPMSIWMDAWINLSIDLNYLNKKKLPLKAVLPDLGIYLLLFCTWIKSYNPKENLNFVSETKQSWKDSVSIGDSRNLNTRLKRKI